MGCLGPHREVIDRQGFTGSFFTGEFKTQEWELKLWEGKARGQMISYLSQPDLSKKRELHERGGLALYLVWQLAMCVLEMGVFEVDASAIKTLMSGTYVTVKKANCQALTRQCRARGL